MARPWPVDNRGVLDNYLCAKELLNNGVPPGSIARLGRPIPKLGTQPRTPHTTARGLHLLPLHASASAAHRSLRSVAAPLGRRATPTAAYSAMPEPTPASHALGIPSKRPLVPRSAR